MKCTDKLLTGILLAVTWLTFAAIPAHAAEPLPEIPHAIQPREGLLIGGQPDEEQMRRASEAGVKTVINVRGAGEETGYDQAAVARDLGMTYIAIPVSGRDDLNPESVAAFGKALEIAGDRPALIHCASGNRVGALFALHAGLYGGKSPEEAVEIGRQHGLTRLEPAVREMLAAPE